MNISTETKGLFACLLLLASAGAVAQTTGFEPPDDGYDWLQLTSGEWLRGDLGSVFDEEVEFESDILDDLIIELEDVAGFVSPRTFGIRTRGGQTYTGLLRLDGEKIVIFSAGRELTLARDDVISITDSAERERDRWTGDISLGVNGRTGNAEFVEYNMKVDLERRTPLSRWTLEYIGHANYVGSTSSSDERELVANNHRVNGIFDRFSGTRFFWRPLSLQYLRDQFVNIAHQGTAETGLGYELINSDKTEWEVHAAAGVNFTERVSVEAGQKGSSSSPSLTIGTDFDKELTSWMDYLLSFQISFLNEEAGRYQHHLLTTLSTDLLGDLDFDVSVEWTRVENPPPDENLVTPEQDDFRLIVGISYEF